MAVDPTTSISQSETVLCNLSILSEPHGNHTLVEIVDPFLNSDQQLCVDEQREDNVQLDVTATVYIINNDNNKNDHDCDDDWDGGPVVEKSVSEVVLVEPPPRNGDPVDNGRL